MKDTGKWPRGPTSDWRPPPPPPGMTPHPEPEGPLTKSDVIDLFQQLIGYAVIVVALFGMLRLVLGVL